MSVPRILLLAPFLPGEAHAGSVFTNDLVRHYPRGMLCWFAVTPNSPGHCCREDSDELPVAWAPLPPESGITKLGRHVHHAHTLLVHQYLRRVRVPALIEQAVQFGRRHEIDLVWAILHHHPTLTYVAKPVAEALNAELVTNVHDPPQRFIIDRGLEGPVRRFIQRMIEDALATTLQASVRCGAASEGMRETYKRQYGVDSVVLIHGLPPSQVRPPAKKLTTSTRFVIGFAGSLYAQQEWQALLGALDNVDWRIEGREVTIRIMGGMLNLRTRSKMNVEYLGWRSLEETLDELSTVDVTYLPYWFDEAYRDIVRLSFPNKLSTYLAAGRPVFYHGPEEATPARFMQRYPAGVCCHSLSEVDILECLQCIIDGNFYASTAQHVQSAVEQELNLAVFLRRFAAFVGIQETDLLPVATRDNRDRES